MKVLSLKRYRIQDIEPTDENVVFIYYNKNVRSLAAVSYDELKANDIDDIEKFLSDKDSYKIWILLDHKMATYKEPEKYTFHGLEIKEHINIYEKPQRINLGTYVPTPIQYVYYPAIQQSEKYIQRDGILVVAGMTGNGKTHFALNQIIREHKQFDTILYMSFELTVNDIYNRLIKMAKGSDTQEIMNKIDVWESKSIVDLKKYLKEHTRVLIVLDNADYLVGSNPEDMYSYQLSYMKQLATELKGSQNHCIALVQIIKDVSLEMFDSNGEFKFINATIVSGVKQITDIARSVLVVGKNQNDQYKNKLVKVGSAVNAPSIL